MRDMSKAIKEYEQKFKGTNKGYFLASEYQQIKDMSADTWDCIHNSMMAGFIIGYRFANREMKQK